MKERWRGVGRIACLIFIDLISYYSALFAAIFANEYFISFFTRNKPYYFFSYQYYFSIWWMPAIFIAILAFEKLYTSRYPFWEEMRSILKSVTITFLFIFLMVTVRSMYGNISRLALIFTWIFLSITMIILRYWGKRVLYHMGLWKEKALVIGTDPSAVNTVKGLTNEKQLGYSVVGFIDDNKSKKEIDIEGKKYPVFSGIKNFTKFVTMLEISTVIISMPRLSRDELTKLTNHVQKYVKNVVLVPDIVGIAQINTELHYLFMQKLFLLKIKNNLHSITNHIIKTAADIIIVIFLLPFFLVFLAVISLLIKLDSEGPVFIIQDRLGYRGKIFNCVKFRTMYIGSDKILSDHLSKNKEATAEWKTYKKLRHFDPRVTRIGAFLRKTSLDEIPQLFNVMKAEMSLIGPRPYLPSEKQEIEDYVDVIFMTKPGLTGLWQVSGRNELIFSERMKLDTWYVENWSVWLDVMILFKTIGAVLQRKGAY
ncbi:MAG: undecaprenyl-phosphate galactose phosphotransferase WbaP [Brevinematales bacterium]|jgi:undecaprenyl-phosphate galactose phosphotransferase